MVGKTGFEPATPWSQTKCSTKLSYFPLTKYGAPERSRTPNLLIRSQTLYPIELRALIHDVLSLLYFSDSIILSHCIFKCKHFFIFLWCGREDLNLHGVSPTRPST